jgi:hypothetical protein
LDEFQVEGKIIGNCYLSADEYSPLSIVIGDIGASHDMFTPVSDFGCSLHEPKHEENKTKLRS